METTETTITQPVPEEALIITPEGKYYLHTIGRWAGFFGILGFIFTGLIVLLVIFIGSFFSLISTFQQQFGQDSNPAAIAGMQSGLYFIRFIYLGLAVINFFGAYYLAQFATKIKKAVALNNTPFATSAFENLKSFFKLIGITTIVVLSLDILFLVIAIIGVAAVTHSSIQ